MRSLTSSFLICVDNGGAMINPFASNSFANIGAASSDPSSMGGSVSMSNPIMPQTAPFPQQSNYSSFMMNPTQTHQMSGMS